MTQEEDLKRFLLDNPFKDEINCMNMKGIRFDTDAKITFFRHRDTSGLSMNINLYAKTDDDRVDEDAAEILMFVERVPADITDINELKGRKFNWDKDSKLCGTISCFEDELNYRDIIEFIDVTEDKILVRWSGIGSIGYGILGHDIPFDTLFEARIIFENTDRDYPRYEDNNDNSQQENISDPDEDKSNDEKWNDASKFILCDRVSRTTVILYHTDDSYLIWFNIMIAEPENITIYYDNYNIIGKKAANIEELNGAEFCWEATGKHGWSECDHKSELKINSITKDRINITLRSHWLNSDTDTAVEVTFEDTYSIEEIGKNIIVSYSANPGLKLVD